MNINDSFFPQHAGTAGGTLTVFLANITSGDVLKTAIQAVVGAVFSFIVSWILRTWLDKRRR